MENFDEEYFEEPQNDENLKKEEKDFLERYYKEILSSLLSGGQEMESGKDEIVPYEVIVFSEQPGVLK